jgi:hypothetical protein
MFHVEQPRSFAVQLIGINDLFPVSFVSPDIPTVRVDGKEFVAMPRTLLGLIP